jgi:hypothetical protein
LECHSFPSNGRPLDSPRRPYGAISNIQRKPWRCSTFAHTPSDNLYGTSSKIQTTRRTGINQCQLSPLKYGTGRAMHSPARDRRRLILINRRCEQRTAAVPRDKISSFDYQIAQERHIIFHCLFRATVISVQEKRHFPAHSTYNKILFFHNHLAQCQVLNCHSFLSTPSSLGSILSLFRPASFVSCVLTSGGSAPSISIDE